MKPDFISESKSLLNPSGRWAIIAAVIAALALSGAALQYVFHFQRSSSAPSSNLAKVTPSIRAVSALGHLRPEGEVIYLWGIAQYGSLKAEKVVN